MQSKLILASGSPRRKELLRQIGLTFTVDPAHGEECAPDADPETVCISLAKDKAREIAGKYQKEGAGGTICVLGADTIVSLGGVIYGKPKDAADAARMLRELSGKTHQVYTGVDLVTLYPRREETEASFVERTNVTIAKMTDTEIDDYVRTGDPADKAGAYGIQGIFARYIVKIDGDYNNVVGLPVGRLWREMLRGKITV